MSASKDRFVFDERLSAWLCSLGEDSLSSWLGSLHVLFSFCLFWVKARFNFAFCFVIWQLGSVLVIFVLISSEWDGKAFALNGLHIRLDGFNFLMSCSMFNFLSHCFNVEVLRAWCPLIRYRVYDFNLIPFGVLNGLLLSFLNEWLKYLDWLVCTPVWNDS